MIIKQEETSPIQDAYDKLRLETAFDGITAQAGASALDSDLLIVYCEETQKLLKDFVNSIENTVKKLQKAENIQKFKTKLHGNDALGD